MKVYCEVNKGNKGMAASMFVYNRETWNSFSTTSDNCIKKGMIRQAVGKMMSNSKGVEKACNS